MGVSVRTAYKWWKHYREEGLSGLQDRSSRPLNSPARTPEAIEAKVIALRRQKRIYDLIAEQTGLSRATVGRNPVRHGLNRWRDLEPVEPVIRYERDRPGEMIHMEIKKLGKFNRIGHCITGDRHGQSNARGIRHVHTKPYTPKTNGKAERFIQSSLREWADAQAYKTLEQRKEELPYWLHHYNWHRPHPGIKRDPPISRSGLDMNNLSRRHT